MLKESKLERILNAKCSLVHRHSNLPFFLSARISHATQILKDPEVYNMAKKLRVPIEVLVSSNLKTSAVATVWDHPIKQFLQDGISVSISTDDPGIFGTDLNGKRNKRI